jgi:hypothetical protein
MDLVDHALSNPTTLWAVVISGVILFVLMTRELALWFFNISRVERRLEEIQSSMARMEETLRKSEVRSAGDSAVGVANAIELNSNPSAPAAKVSAPKEAFPLQH